MSSPTPLEELLLSLPNSVKGEGVAWITFARDKGGVVWTAGYEVANYHKKRVEGHYFDGTTVREALRNMTAHLKKKDSDRYFITELFSRPSGGEE